MRGLVGTELIYVDSETKQNEIFGIKKILFVVPQSIWNCQEN